MNPAFGVCGPSGLGKSTLSAHVIKLLENDAFSVDVVPLDTFMKRADQGADRPNLETLGTLDIPKYVDLLEETIAKTSTNDGSTTVVLSEGYLVHAIPEAMAHLKRVYMLVGSHALAAARRYSRPPRNPRELASGRNPITFSSYFDSTVWPYARSYALHAIDAAAAKKPPYTHIVFLDASQDISLLARAVVADLKGSILGSTRQSAQLSPSPSTTPADGAPAADLAVAFMSPADARDALCDPCAVADAIERSAVIAAAAGRATTSAAPTPTTSDPPARAPSLRASTGCGRPLRDDDEDPPVRAPSLRADGGCGRPPRDDDEDPPARAPSLRAAAGCPRPPRADGTVDVGADAEHRAGSEVDVSAPGDACDDEPAPRAPSLRAASECSRPDRVVDGDDNGKDDDPPPREGSLRAAAGCARPLRDSIDPPAGDEEPAARASAPRASGGCSRPPRDDDMGVPVPAAVDAAVDRTDDPPVREGSLRAGGGCERPSRERDDGRDPDLSPPVVTGRTPKRRAPSRSPEPCRMSDGGAAHLGEADADPSPSPQPVTPLPAKRACPATCSEAALSLSPGSPPVVGGAAVIASTIACALHARARPAADTAAGCARGDTLATAITTDYAATAAASLPDLRVLASALTELPRVSCKFCSVPCLESALQQHESVCESLVGGRLVA